MKKQKETKPMTPLRAFFDKLIFSFYVIALVCAICFSSFVWFQKTYFVNYWVNGQSMWPTLNKDTKTADGIPFDDSTVRKSMNGAYDVDFIIGDTHQNILDGLKRFDIVVCKYSESDSFEKIKRIIALPGETFYIDAVGEDKEGNGTLHILNNETGEFEVVAQPVEQWIIEHGKYPYEYAQPFTLKENEYFVMGDNRAHSSDSRLNGPVTKDNIEAKAIAIVAKCRIIVPVGGSTYTPTDIDYDWPRFL